MLQRHRVDLCGITCRWVSPAINDLHPRTVESAFGLAGERSPRRDGMRDTPIAG